MTVALWLSLLTIAIVLLVVVAVAVSLAQRRDRLAVERLSEEVRALRGDLGALCTGAVGVSERVARIEGQARRLTERQDQLELSGGEDNRPYDRAIELATRGSSAEELVKECGLTMGEAELVVMMHRIERG